MEESAACFNAKFCGHPHNLEAASAPIAKLRKEQSYVLTKSVLLGSIERELCECKQTTQFLPSFYLSFNVYIFRF